MCLGFLSHHMLLNGESHCPDMVLFNLISITFKKTREMNIGDKAPEVLGVNEKGEEILLLLFQNLFPISSFGSFTPWGRAEVGRRLRASVRYFSYFSNFLPGCSREHTVACGRQSRLPLLLFIHPISQLFLPPFHQGDSENTWKPPECSIWGKQNLDP